MASVGFVNREGRFDMNQRLRQVVFLTLLLGLGGLGTGAHGQFQPYRGPMIVPPAPSIHNPQPFTPSPMIPTPSLQPSFPTVAPSPSPVTTGRLYDNHRSSTPQPEEDEPA